MAVVRLGSLVTRPSRPTFAAVVRIATFLRIRHHRRNLQWNAFANDCTPGITIPTASGGNDNCGYPSTSFNESQFICGIVATGGGAAPGQVQAFFNDEMSTTLGCTQNGYTVSPMPSDPGYVYYPSTGDSNLLGHQWATIAAVAVHHRHHE